ncbi:MAG: hypothetical protein AAF242_16335 [Bacteroidota bacterium]
MKLIILRNFNLWDTYFFEANGLITVGAMEVGVGALMMVRIAGIFTESILLLLAIVHCQVD